MATVCAALAAGCAAAGPRQGGASQSAVTGPSSSASIAAGKSGKHADFLTGISCPSPASCLAVGWYYDSSAGPDRTLVERWDGRAWRVLPLPPAAWRGRLTAISCASAAACTAVGSPVVGWNGHAWRVELRSSPFTAVSCPAPAACVAVGQTSAGRGAAGLWDGRAWRMTPVPPPPHRAQSVTLAGVSCWAPDGCLAIGDYSYGASAKPTARLRDRTLAMEWNGSRWRLVPSPDVARRDQFAAVSCPAPSTCQAVGSAKAKVTLAELWTGGRWHAEPTPDFGSPGYSRLTGVWCLAVARCVAVGDYDLSVPHSQRLAAGRWRVLPMAVPPGAQGVQGMTVSCAGQTCEAVGAIAGRLLAERLTGASWRLQRVPQPR